MDTKNAFQRLNSLSTWLIFTIIASITSLPTYLNASETIVVSSAKDGQLFPSVVRDGEGGVIVFWEDYRTGRDWDVYVRRVDSRNKPIWDLDGDPISIAASNQRRLRAIQHGRHAIVVWNDRRNKSSWDIYAQAVNIEGDVFWQKDGMPICTDSADQSTQAILSDGEGGAIVVWEDERRSAEFQDLYIQRITSTGITSWEKNGIPVYPSESLQSNPVLVEDDSGGFYVVWWDVVGIENWHIMAFRLSMEGKPLWDAPLLITPKDGMQGEPRVVADGKGGFIVVWQIYENFINDQLYAQRISPDGKKLWQETGVPVCTADGIQKNAAVVYDGEGGLIAVWRDERDIYGDLYAQRIHADGTLAWQKDGIPLCTVGGHQDRPFIVQTEEKQFFVAWMDYRGDIGEKSVDAIYCQKIDLDGNLLWKEEGVPVSTSKGEHFPPFVVPVGNGQCVVVWSNSQQDNGDIFLKRF
ncbi:MAG: hypothetical protein OXI67_18980 [Candidatus Poribacteria bacterium]|nr:hypothetical protein [Candidatus Poribacteria bacterium]